jgi:phosphoribosylpyrophosphate synthetase
MLINKINLIKGTLIKATETLKNNGAKKVFAFATHGCF